MRRANHDKIQTPLLVACPNCGSPMRPHHVCGSCGTYKGRDVLPKKDEAKEE
jgi:large subunit ribosomal protein L32